MSAKTSPEKPSAGKPFMSNAAKLIIIVLGFFLALTYVRGFEIGSSSNEVIFQGNNPVKFNVSVLNNASFSAAPAFIADGPFTISLPENVPETLPARDSHNYELTLTPTPSFGVGDVYSGQIRINSSSGQDVLPLTLRMGNPPLIPTSAFTGLFSFTSGTGNIVDVFLIIIIVILAIALLARVKNRVMGE